MKTFENLARRGIHYFVATMPAFRAATSEAANEGEQANAYRFIKGMYDQLYEHPERFGLKLYPDDCFPYWWTKKTEKPGLPYKIRGYMKDVNLMMEAIHTIAYAGEAEGDTITLARDSDDIKPAMLKRLAGFGISAEKGDGRYRFTFPEGTVKGLKLLALISAEHARNSATAIHTKRTTPFLLFSHGVFAPEAPYTAEIFRNLFENTEAYDKLTAYLNKERFIRIDNKEYKTGIHGDTVSLDYVKFYGKPEGVVGNSWRTKNFSGVELSYDALNQDCTRVGVHIPYFRKVLEDAGKMSAQLREFVSKWNKCTNCRYCVQLDKSKTKPLRFVRVNERDTCSVFASGCTFNHFYDGLWMADSIIELLKLVDELFADRRVER